MKVSPYLVNDLARLLIKFAQRHEIPDSDPLMKVFYGYGTQRELNMAMWLSHLDDLAERTQTPDIGLQIGQLAETADGGVLGYLIASCDHLAQAMHQFKRYQRLLYGDEAEVCIVDGQICITWPNPEQDIHRSDESMLSGVFNFVRSITGRDDIEPTKIRFRHSAPDYVDEYYRIFGPNIEFDCDEFSAAVPLDYLNLPILKKELGLQNRLQSQADALMSLFDQYDEFEPQLQCGILDMLKAGHSSLPGLASSMNVSERTLQRRLHDRGMQFSELLKDCRKQLVVTYMKDTTLSLTDIGFLLAYSEQSAFTRAFKQWFGQSPASYRKMLLEAS